MIILAAVALILFAVIATFHAGPHGLVLSGLMGDLLAAVGIAFLLSSGTNSLSSLVLLAVIGVVSVAALGSGVVSLRRLERRSPAIDPGRLWGADGVAVDDLLPHGTVRIKGETWSAESLSGHVRAGSAVHVVEVEGLHLRVLSDAPLEPNAAASETGENS